MGVESILGGGNQAAQQMVGKGQDAMNKTTEGIQSATNDETKSAAPSAPQQQQKENGAAAATQQASALNGLTQPRTGG